LIQDVSKKILKREGGRYIGKLYKKFMG
jgi:hypothetical protein